tara:strand:+ start:4521 stop:5012 length:492 start_codon:yes stop_codon:yes gene_type:complete
MVPVAIWPYLMALAAGLFLSSAIAKYSSAARSLLCILATYAATRGINAAFGTEWVADGIAALTWAYCARFVFNKGSTTASGIIAISALCYFWAAIAGAPKVVGSIPYVISDVLMVAAMVWIGANGVRANIGGLSDMVKRGGGGRYRDIGVHNQAQVTRKGAPQ